MVYGFANISVADWEVERQRGEVDELQRHVLEFSVGSWCWGWTWLDAAPQAGGDMRQTVRNCEDALTQQVRLGSGDAAPSA